MSELTRICTDALMRIACCQPSSVGELGLVPELDVSDGVVKVEILPCCVFGITRLEQSVRNGLLRINGVREVKVTVGWDKVASGPRLVQLDLSSWAARECLIPWGAGRRK